LRRKRRRVRDVQVRSGRTVTAWRHVMLRSFEDDALPDEPVATLVAQEQRAHRFERQL
jgi:hypothetical protein